MQSCGHCSATVLFAVYSQAYDISALLLCRNFTWSYCGHLPGERGLASYPLGFLHLFQKRTFEDKWHGYVGSMPFCYPENSVKALSEAQSTDLNQEMLPASLVLSWSATGLLRKGQCSLCSRLSNDSTLLLKLQCIIEEWNLSRSDGVFVLI